MKTISSDKKQKLKLLKKKLEAKKVLDPKAGKLLQKLSKLSSQKYMKKQKAKEDAFLETCHQDNPKKKNKSKELLTSSPCSPNDKATLNTFATLLFPIDTISKFDLFATVQSNDVSNEYCDKLVQLIRQAAGNRIQDVQVVGKCNSTSKIKLGINVNNEHLLNPINLGPEGDSPDAEDFRNFWGDRAELRRFEDGTIRESVFWESKSLAQARSILLRSLNHAFETHLGLKIKDNVSYDHNRLQNVLLHTVKPFTIGTGEQYRQLVVTSTDELEKLLRSLTLKLPITGIRSTSAVLRGTEVCFEPPILTQLSFEHSKKDQYLINPIELVLQVEQNSSHWPMKLKPLKSIKTAFYLDILDQLKAKKVPGLRVKFHTDFLDVLFNQYVFRLHLFVPREFTLLQSAKNHKGETNRARLREAILMDKQLRILPEIAAHFNVLNQTNINFGTAARLAKVWVSAHYLADYLNDIAVELILAKIFMDNPDIYYLRAFVLFLQMLFTYDWFHRPLLVNLNREFSDEQVVAIEQQFAEDRNQFPLMAICTPFDSTPSMWTRHPLTPLLPVVFGRLIKLARGSYLQLARCISESKDDAYDQIFRTDANIFDVTIELNTDLVANYHYNVQRNQQANRLHHHCILYHVLCIKCRQAKKRPKPASFPIVQQNYAHVLLRLLREQFGQYALFFYDNFGGDRIGMLWKPESRQPETLDLDKLRAHSLCELADSEGNTQMQLNLEQVLEDIELIGGQLIKQIMVKGVKRDKAICFPSLS